MKIPYEQISMVIILLSLSATTIVGHALAGSMQKFMQ